MKKSIAKLIIAVAIQILLLASVASAVPSYSRLSVTSESDFKVLLTGTAMDSTSSLKELVFYIDNVEDQRWDCRNRAGCSHLFVDYELNSSTTHSYKIKAVSNDGGVLESNTITKTFGGYTPTLPSWSNPRTNPASGAVYDPEASYEFLVDFALSGRDVVLFESNLTGAFTSEHMQYRYGDTYVYTSGALPAGTYQWRAHGSDTSGNYNVTDNQTFEIAKAAPVIRLFLDDNEGDITVERMTFVDVEAVIEEGEPAEIRIYKDDLLLTETIIGYYVPFYEEGTFEIIAEYVGTGNYNATNISRFVTVDDTVAPGPVSGINLTNASYHELTWEWLNPADADFNHTNVTIYNSTDDVIDSVDVMGSNSTMSNATFSGLLESSDYYITLETYDHYGNTDPLSMRTSSTESTASDAEAPVFSGEVPANNTTVVYDPSASYQFNITCFEPHLDSMQITHNFNDPLLAPVADNMTGNSGDVYYFDAGVMNVGAYSWEVWANDTAGNANTSDSYTFEIVQAQPELNMTLNSTEGDITVERLVPFNVVGNIVTGDAAAVNLYVNDSPNVSGITLGAPYAISFDATGTFPIMIEYTGSQNYAPANMTRNVQVVDSMATGPIGGPNLVSVNGSAIEWDWTIPLDDDFNHTLVTLYLASDNSTVAQELVNASLNSVVFSGLSEATSYWASFQTFDTFGNTDPANIVNSSVVSTTDVTVPQFSNYVETYTADYNPNGTHVLSVDAADNQAVDTVVFEIEGDNSTVVTNVSNTYSVNLTLAAGNYTARWHANDTTGNWAVSNDVNITINRIPSSIDLTLEGGNSDISIIEGQSVSNITAELLAGETDILVTRNTTSVLYSGPGVPAWTDSVPFPTPGHYNITASYAQSENYTASYDTLYVTVAPITKNVTIEVDSPWMGTTNTTNATFTLTVTNTGNVEDNYSVSFVDLDGAATIALNGSATASITDLQPLQSAVVLLEVGDPNLGDYNVSVVVASDTEPASTDSVMTTTTVADTSEVINSTIAGIPRTGNFTVMEIPQLLGSGVYDSVVDALSIISVSTLNAAGITESNIVSSDVSDSLVSGNSTVDVSSVSAASTIEQSDIDSANISASYSGYSTINGAALSSDARVSYSSVLGASTVIDDSDLDNATVTNSQISAGSVIESGSVIDDSAIIFSRIVDNSLIDNSTVNDSDLARCTVIDSFVDGLTASDCFIDPSNVTDTTITGNTSITDSNVSDSDLNDAAITLSNLDYAGVMQSNVSGSDITNSSVNANSEITGSTVADSQVSASDIDNAVIENGSGVRESTVDSSTVTGGSDVHSSVIESGSTLTSATIDNVTVTNTVVENSTVEDAVLTNANVTSGVIYSGTITQAGQTYDADASGPGNLTDVINYAPVAVISPVSPTITTGGSVSFDASGSSDPNPSDVNFTYSWDFGDGSNTSSLSAVSHTYAAAGEYNVTLNVTDDGNATGTVQTTVTVNDPAGDGEGSGGSGGSGRSSSSFYPGNTYTDIGIPLGGSTTMTMLERDVMIFEYDGENHSITVVDINNIKKEVKLKVQSTPFEMVVGEGQKGGVNLDENLDHDLFIKVDSITSATSAIFTFSLQGEPEPLPQLPPAPEPTPQPQPTLQPEQQPADNGTEADDEESMAFSEKLSAWFGGLTNVGSWGSGIKGFFGSVWGGIAGAWGAFASWLTSSAVVWKAISIIAGVVVLVSVSYILIRRALIEMEIRSYY